jgi:hypothetical protein
VLPKDGVGLSKVVAGLSKALTCLSTELAGFSKQAAFGLSKDDGGGGQTPADGACSPAGFPEEPALLHSAAGGSGGAASGTDNSGCIFRGIRGRLGLLQAERAVAIRFFFISDRTSPKS